MKLVGFILCLGIFVGQPIWANVVPPNHAHLEPQRSRDNQEVTEQIFYELADGVFEVFDQPVYSLGGNLKLFKSWASDLVAASAVQDNGSWNVHLYGGLARRHEMTADGFLLVICHELGHHMAGYPQASSWASSEANSDYFAVQDCARKLWENQIEQNYSLETMIAEVPRSLCDERYMDQGEERTHLCYREMMAAYSLGRLLASLEGTEVSWDNPSEEIVDKTNLAYPSAQCRFDTMIQSALCDVMPQFSIIPWNEREMASMSCHDQSGQSIGSRPRCWFKPRNLDSGIRQKFSLN